MSQMFSSPLTPTPITPPARWQKSPIFASPARASSFENSWAPMEQPNPKDMLRWKAGKNPWREQKRAALPPNLAPDPLGAFEALPQAAKLLWAGHASALIELDGVRCLIDPVFGPAAVVPRKRPSPLAVQMLPHVHAILLTHGHYDHFEAKVLKQLGDRFGQDTWFIVPKRLGRYLPKSCQRVVELGWWEHVKLDQVQITLVPSQHWHRRGLRDYNAALWGGWYLSGSQRIYHMGDSGYFDGFKAVRDTLGSPDLAMLPLGAWEPRWFMGYQHMAPEQTLQTWDDLGARHMVAMHWGVFDLADEPVDLGPTYFRELLQEKERPELSERFFALQLGATVGVDEREAHVEGGLFKGH